MNPEIATHLAPFITGLSAEQYEQISRHLELLLLWNQRINLSGIRSREEIITRHFGESLFAARELLDPQSEIKIVDVGSGAGFPGIAIKIYAPRTSLTMIESQNKKATFLREAIRTLGMTQAEVFDSRAEKFEQTADLVTMRAVEKFEHILPVAGGLVRPGGRIGLLVGQAQEQSAYRLLPDFQWKPSIPMPQSTGRILLVGVNPRHGEERAEFPG